MELLGCHPEFFPYSSHLGEYGIAVSSIVGVRRHEAPFAACCNRQVSAPVMYPPLLLAWTPRSLTVPS
jgi:hypothetical protein